MSRSRKGGQRTSLLERVRRLRYLIVLVSGFLGVGGWQFKDHPLLQKIFQSVASSDPDGPLLDKDLVKSAVQALEHRGESFREPGSFDVKVSAVKIDPALIRSGQAGELQVRVRKRDVRGRETTVWDSKSAGSPSGDTNAAGWPNDSFRVDWQPGEQFTVDVWQGRGLFSTKHFELLPGAAETFPLRSGAQNLSLVGMDPSLKVTEANQIVFDARRVDAANTDANVQRTARSPETVRDDDTIVIK